MHSPSRRSGKYSPAFTPKLSRTLRSCSGNSMADQSGRCNTFFSTIARDGKLAVGSTGIAPNPMSGMRPSGVAQATTEKVLPSHRIKNAESLAISFTAVTTMALNTGRTSVGDWLITRRISAVAVSRSNASLVSLNRRTFSIAITAWSAKVSTSAIWRGENASTWWRQSVNDADRLSVAHQRHSDDRAIVLDRLPAVAVLGVVHRVQNLDGAPLAGRTAGRGPTVQRNAVVGCERTPPSGRWPLPRRPRASGPRRAGISRRSSHRTGGLRS